MFTVWATLRNVSGSQIRSQSTSRACSTTFLKIYHSRV